MLIVIQASLVLEGLGNIGVGIIITITKAPALGVRVQDVGIVWEFSKIGDPNIVP